MVRTVAVQWIAELLVALCTALLEWSLADVHSLEWNIMKVWASLGLRVVAESGIRLESEAGVQIHSSGKA